MKQSELIKWYEERLEKVIAFWSNAHNGSEYIEQAKKEHDIYIKSLSK